MIKPVFFNQALERVADLLVAEVFPEGVKPLVIRDIYGRFRIAINTTRSEHADLEGQLRVRLTQLGAFSGGDKILFQDDLFHEGISLFESPDILNLYLSDAKKPMRLLDRTITGQDWLRPNNNENSAIPRLVFFGVKGGVGRSTALTVLAYKLAKEGKRVLLIDLDLESPGLSSLLLPPDRLAEAGIVDWFIEDAVGQGDEILTRMTVTSPLSLDTPGEIRVVAAMGLDEKYYLSKLSRVYADIAGAQGVERFSHRMARFVTALEAQEKPNVVLIDSRAGLHDLAAVSIVNMATYTFLFASDTAQTWQAYRLLFSHWQIYPEILKSVRDRLLLVEALFPDNNQQARIGHFLDKAYTLFSETIYEEDKPTESLQDIDIFNFDMNDPSAPHYPLQIKWNNRFQEFDPLLLDKGILTDDDVAATFGHFLTGVNRLLDDKT